MLDTVDNSLSRAEFARLGSFRRSQYAFNKGIQWGFEGSLLSVPFLAATVASSQRGEKLSAGLATGISTITYPIFQGAIAAALSVAIPGVGAGALLFGSMFAAMYPTSVVEGFTSRKLRQFSQIGRSVRRLETGGFYEDTESASRSRIQAVFDMSATMQASRRYLGQEARILHR